MEEQGKVGTERVSRGQCVGRGLRILALSAVALWTFGLASASGQKQATANQVAPNQAAPNPAVPNQAPPNRSVQTTEFGVHLVYPRSGDATAVLPDGTVAVLGGVGADGRLVNQVEIVDPKAGETRVIADTGLTARTQQTATTLTDGQVLIAGGLGPNGQPLSSAELWDPQSGQVGSVNQGLTLARSGQQAMLLPDGNVLISGGQGGNGQSVSSSEFYDVQSGAFSPVTSANDPRLTAASAASQTANVQLVLPASDTNAVAVDARVAIRLSTPLDASTGANQVVSVVGPGGAVAGNAVAADGGMLLFFTPSAELLPQATYTVFLQGAKNSQGQSFPFSTSSFTTRNFNATPGATASGSSATATSGKTSLAEPSGSMSASSATSHAAPATAKAAAQKTANPDTKPNTPDDDTANEDWTPQKQNRHGEWRVLGLQGDPVLKPSAAATVSLTAPAGQTAVSGRVLRYHGKPLAGVAVSIAGQSAVTNSTGQFLLTGLSAGVTQLEVDGTAVVKNGRHYTKHFIRVDIAPGKTTTISDPIYLPRVDPSTEVSISSPASQELVLTHPAIPGLEVHIPKGAVLREYDGKIVTKLSITPIPLDRPPYPTPAHFSVYFTLQPGGAFVDADSGKSIRVIYPNYQGLPAGTRANFWNYDPSAGWQIYGHGTVSADGKQVVPDANVGFRQNISFGMAVDSTDAPPSKGPPEGDSCEHGDPVDCSTGLFIHTVTDLALRDVLPISVTRTYRQNDPTAYAFGVGTNLSYAMRLYTGSTASAPAEIDLIQANGSRVPYLLASGNSLANGVWTQTTTPSIYYGSKLAAFNNSSGEGFTITLRDRTVLTFGRHAPNGLLSITDRNGNTVTITTTDPSTGGTITQITSPNGRYIQFSYFQGRIIQAIDNIGRTVSYAYDSLGRLSSATDPNGKTESYAYDSNNRMTSVTDKRGSVMVTNVYDTNGRVTQQTLADGAVWKFAYALDGDGNVTQTTITDPRNYIEQEYFNSSGYLTKDIRAQGQPEQQTLTFQRDGANQVLSQTDALGRNTQLSYDGFGNVKSVTGLAGTANAVTVSFTYDSTYQEVTSYTDPLSHTSSIAYDWLGNPTSATDPLGNVIQRVNDASGRPTSLTNALGKVTRLTYNQGDLSAIVDPLGRTVSMFTDAAGRLVGIADPLGHSTRFDYDPLDRISRITDALGGVTAKTYDANGNVLTVQDARGLATHTFTYDLRNRVKTYSDPLGNTETYNYDAMGNLSSKVDRKGQTKSFQYDGLNRPTSLTFADNSSITVTWDAGNRATQFVDTTNGTITRQYDGLDRMTQEVNPQGQVNYVYDAAGRRTQFTVNGLAAVTYQYDNGGRLTQIAQGSAVIGMSYDTANRRTGLTLPNGIATTATYDDGNQLLALSYDQGATHIGDLAYGYDLSGRRVSQSGSLARLALPASVTSASYNAANQLTNWGASSLAYDNNGNLTSLGSASYGWNARDQLISTSDGGSEFTYDAAGRRVSATVSAVTTPYLYDGASVATVAGSQMLGGPGVDDVHARVNGSAATSFITDSLGSTLMLTDGTAATTATYAYSPYGATSKTGTDSTPFEYTGRDNDGATNLYYYRARYYSPTLNRFISQDPLRLRAGVNFYAYAGGDPVSYRDPSGKDPLLGIVGAIAGGAWGYVNGVLSGDTGNQLWVDIGAGVVSGGLIGLTDGLSLAESAAVNMGIEADRQVINQRISGHCDEPLDMRGIFLAGFASVLGDVAGSAVAYVKSDVLSEALHVGVDAEDFENLARFISTNVAGAITAPYSAIAGGYVH